MHAPISCPANKTSKAPSPSGSPACHPSAIPNASTGLQQPIVSTRFTCSSAPLATMRPDLGTIRTKW